MPSSKDRERKLARAKIDRQQTRRAQQIRVQRQLQARIGAVLAILLVAAGIGWATNWYGLTSKKSTANAQCTWTPATGATLKNVGQPPTTGLTMSGTAPLTITTSQGVIDGTLDVTDAPCTSASFTYLASKDFFNNTKCHRLTTAGIFVLQCGDQQATPDGHGGPTYTLADENIPVTEADQTATTTPTVSNTVYKAGTIAMALTTDPKTGTVNANSGGSQFFLVYKDTTLPDSYPIVGSFDAAGIAVVNKIAAGGIASGSPSVGGPPKLTTTIQTFTVGKITPPAPPSPAPSPSNPSAPASPSSASTPAAPSSSKS